MNLVLQWTIYLNIFGFGYAALNNTKCLFNEKIGLLVLSFHLYLRTYKTFSIKLIYLTTNKA